MGKEFLILRIGLAVTFVGIGVMIFQNPEAWGGYIRPWAAGLVPIPLFQAMRATAALDIVIGVLFVVRPLVGLAGLLGTLHLAVVLIVSGITDITIRDIGLLAASLAAAVYYWPKKRGLVIK